MLNDHPKYIEKFFQKIQPDNIEENLIRASLFITAYEVLYIELVEKIIDFYCHGDFDDDLKPLESEQYKKEVLLLTKKGRNRKFNSSCEWWKNNGTLTSEDIQEIKKIRDERNKIAHELPKILLNPDFSIDLSLFSSLKEYTEKLTLFWIRITIASHDEFDEREITDEQIMKENPLIIDLIERLVNKI